MHHLSSLGGGLLLALTAVGLPAQDSSSPASSVDFVNRSPGFMANRGQWAEPVRYRYSSDGMAAWVHDDGLTLRLAAPAEGGVERGVVLRWTFEDAAPSHGTRGRDALPGVHNFLIGRDKSRWALGVRSFARTVARNAYPGIDVIWQERDGRLAYDLHVAPGADPTQVVTRVDGATSLRLDRDGNMIVVTDAGEVRITAPVSWENDGARRRPVDSRFVLDGATSYRIAVERVNPDAQLVIDPGLEWASVWGSPGDEQMMGVARDDQDRVYTAGFTDSAAYPTTPGVFQTDSGLSEDAVVSCFDPSLQGTAQLLWSTYYGGDSSDHGFDIACNPAGTRITLVGATRSSDLFASANTLQPENGGNWDGFVVQLTNNGRNARWATYIGGIRNDFCLALHRIAADTMIIGGVSGNEDGFPLGPTGFQLETVGGDDAFIMALNPNGSANGQRRAATMFGGNRTEFFSLAGARQSWDRTDVAVAPNGDYLLVGTTRSTNLPTTPGAFQPDFGGGGAREDAYVALFSPDLVTLKYCSYLGGENNDWPGGAGFTTDGEIIIAGTTQSNNLPVSSNPIRGDYGGALDGFICKIDPAGNGTADLVYSSYLGDSGNEAFYDCHVEKSGIVVACGENSGGMPVTPGGYFNTSRGAATVVRVDPDNNGPADLHYVSRFGDGGDEARAITPTSDGAFFVVGNTNENAQFPVTPGSYSSPLSGGEEMFAARLDTLPTNMTRLTETQLPVIGTVTVPGAPCTGGIDLQVSAMPASGLASFDIIANDSPPNSQVGLLLVGFPMNGSFLTLRREMFPFLGASAPTDVAARAFVLPDGWQYSEDPSNPGSPWLPGRNAPGMLFRPDNGFTRVTIPLPFNLPSGPQNIAFQFVFLGTPTCGGQGNMFASDRISF